MFRISSCLVRFVRSFCLSIFSRSRRIQIQNSDGCELLAEHIRGCASQCPGGCLYDQRLTWLVKPCSICLCIGSTSTGESVHSIFFREPVASHWNWHLGVRRR